MRAAIYDISTGAILRTVDCPPDHISIQCAAGEDFFINCPAEATHIINNEAVAVPQVPDVAQVVAGITSAVQHHLDDMARVRNYDGILSLASYANSTDPVFAAEAAAGITWRDACWRYCYQQLDAVTAGLRPMPTPDEAVSELPGIIWPQ
jgi:hypothetical protein